MRWDGQWYWVVGTAGYPVDLPLDAAGHVGNVVQRGRKAQCLQGGTGFGVAILRAVTQREQGFLAPQRSTLPGDGEHLIR